ncbi:MAG: hypothetical protein AAF125_11105, partial [Chloroflexota bacterium]
LMRANREQSASVRSIYRSLRLPRKAVVDVLKALEADGLVERAAPPNQRGRPSEVYRFVE